MSMYDKYHYNIVISLQLIKINEKKNKPGKRKKEEEERKSCCFPSCEDIEQLPASQEENLTKNQISKKP